MAHEFVDLYVAKERQFSVGIDRATGMHYVSFLQMTANRQSEFEVYFELPGIYAELAATDPARLESFVDQCRQGLHAALQISPQGGNQ